MKKAFILLFSILMLTSAESASAQAGNETESGNQAQVMSGNASGTPSRRVYCFSKYNPDFERKYGFTIFETSDPSNSMQLLYQFDWREDGDFIYAGAAANDIYYAYFYLYTDRGPLPIAFKSINIRTGKTTEVANWRGRTHEDLNMPKFQDMTYDYVTNTMYAVAYNVKDRSLLVSIDLTNGEITKLVSFERTVATIAASNDGVLYVIDMKGNLCTVDKTNGKLTTIMSTEYTCTYHQTMEFDRTDGALYWATAGGSAFEEATKNYLIRFDLANKTYKNLGVLGGVGTEVLGMYIPFLRAGFDVPGTPADLAAVAGVNGDLKATISWKNPTQTFGNSPLLDITSLSIARDGEIIKTYENVEDLSLGKEMTYEDNTVTNGMHVYSICASNAAGKGEEGKIDRFVGFDKPARVSDFKVQANAPCKSATLTWQPPTEGEYRGYFDGKDLTYTIVRYPDELEIATNISELTFTDDGSSRLTGFTYHVFANNKIGTSKAAISEKVIIGNPLTTPYSFDFIDDGAFNNNWMVYDNSGDRNTWRIHSPMGKLYFGDGILLPAAEYLMDDPAEDCNEWLITPPITLPDREKKVLTFGVRNRGMDQLRITMGNNNTFESQTVELKRIIVESKLPEKSGGVIPFEMVSIDLGEIAGTFCFGFHLQTPNQSSIIFQLSDVYVGAPTAITNEMVSDINVFSINNTLSITGGFTNAQVYNTGGVCVAQIDARQSQIDTSNWAKGIYCVKVVNGTDAKFHKVVIR